MKCMELTIVRSPNYLCTRKWVVVIVWGYYNSHTNNSLHHLQYNILNMLHFLLSTTVVIGGGSGGFILFSGCAFGQFHVNIITPQTQIACNVQSKGITEFLYLSPPTVLDFGVWDLSRGKSGVSPPNCVMSEAKRLASDSGVGEVVSEEWRHPLLPSLHPYFSFLPPFLLHMKKTVKMAIRIWDAITSLANGSYGRSGRVKCSVEMQILWLGMIGNAECWAREWSHLYVDDLLNSRTNMTGTWTTR